MVRSIIIDDEEHCVATLRWQLDTYCPQVCVVDCCLSGAEGLAAIHQHRPDVVFLDIEMPRMNGFELLQKLPQINFDVVFTTAYDQFAIRAIKFSALDYLLKPIDKDELMMAVGKVSSQPPAFMSPDQLSVLIRNAVMPKDGLKKIAIPTLEGYELVQATDIIRCESDSNYTTIYLKGNTKLVASKTLKDVEELLEGHCFFRVHHSHLVNLNEIKKYVKGDGGYLIMTDNSTVAVARSRKDALLNFFAA